MNPEIERTGQNENGAYAQIPGLVEKSIMGRPKDRRRSEKELLDLIKESQHFDPVVIAASYIQQTIVESKQAEGIKTGVTLLNKIVLEGTRTQGIKTEGAAEYRKEISIGIRPATVAAAQSLEANDTLVKKSRFISSQLPSNYGYLMEIASDIQKGAEQGKTMLTITHVERPKGDPSFSLEPINAWAESVRGLLLKIQGESKREITSRMCDDLVDHLKQEPEKGLPGRERLYTRKYGEVSLADMETMNYPLSEEDFDKVTDFLLLAFSDNAQPLHEEDRRVLNIFFSHLTTFDDIKGPVPIRNQSILATINSWQENFVENLLFGDDDRKNSQVKQLIEEKAVYLTELIWAIPHQFHGNPDRPHGVDATLDVFSGHPVTYRYLEEYLAKNPHQAVSRGKYPDELGREYLEEVVIPRLRERLTEFGLIEEKEEEVAFLENQVKENPYSKTHLEAIKTVFEAEAGSYFLERLNNHSQEMGDIAKLVWEETNKKVHFLPLSGGSEVIEFSADSVPNLLGLGSIELITSDAQRGEVLVRFRFKDMNFVLLGTLDLRDEENKLHFKAPLEQDSPGLYTFLNLTGALAMSDLTTQETQEINKRELETENLPTRGKLQGFIEWLRRGFSKKLEKPSYRSLPRVRTQKDQDIINEIHGDFPPRRVSLHRRALVGAERYWNIAGEYVDAIVNQAEEEKTQGLQEEVENARRSLHRISREKKENLPPRFQLGTVEDPVTGEEFYLETWVVEHTSPKPTAEELSSPLQLFRRYYKDSSGLAFLDQLKPWFVGQ